MKIRRFDSRSPAAGATAPPAAPRAQAPAEAGAAAVGPGAPPVPRAAGVAESVKVDRARSLLRTLRADDGGAFGGRVRGGVDVVAALRDYYRALEVAPIALAAGGEAAVTKLVEHLDVPDDIRPLVAAAAGDVPATGPLGNVDTYEQRADSSAFLLDWHASGDPDALRVSDATVRALFGRWGADSDLQAHIGNGDERYQVGVFKLFARAKELGLDVTAEDAEAYTRALPATAATASVLRRFTRAFDLDERRFVLGDRPLPQWQPAGRGAPLGTVSAWENDSNGWYEAVTIGDARAFQVTDATLARLALDGMTRLDTWLAGPEETHLAGLRAFERFAHITTVDDDALAESCRVLAGSKDVARAVKQIGKACGVELGPVVLGDKTVDEWIAGKRAATRPLGGVRTWERDDSYDRIYEALSAAPGSVMAISDATLQRWFGAWGPNRELTAYAYEGGPETNVACSLWWARGKELGLPATCSEGSLAPFTARMPATAQAANALRRLGRAFGFSVEEMSVGGRRVSSFPIVDASTAELPARAELGGKKLLKAALTAALDTSDEALFSVDDASLKRLLDLDAGLIDTIGRSRERGWRLGVLALAERALALGALDGGAVRALIQQLPPAALEDAATGEIVARLVVKAGLAVDDVRTSGGEPITRSAHTAAHVARLQRVLQGASAELAPRRASPLEVKPGPLGGRSESYVEFWNDRDPAMFEISDDRIRDELASLGDFSWLAHWRNAPGVLSLVARIIEVNAEDGDARCNAKDAAIAWLRAPIPSAFGTEDALPRILRLCKAAGVDPHDVVIRHERKRIPLLEHPALRRLEAAERTGSQARAASLAADLAMLSPSAQTSGLNGGPAHPAEREAAALHLLGVTDADHPILHELPEIMGAALRALRDDDFVRVDLARLPQKHKDALLATAFASWDHPAAVAVLAGALFDVDAASVERLLSSQGHLPAVASAMGAVAARLAKASAAELFFCTMGLDKDPPELASLPTRAWLLSGPGVDEILAKIKAAPDEAASLCAAALERAMLADTPRPRRAALVSAVEQAEKRGLVERADVVALLPAAVKVALDEDAAAKAAGAGAALAGARDEAERSAARVRLADVLAEPGWTGDANVVAAAALDAALAHDLRCVAPLGAVDVKAGGVAGKAWESRLARSGPTVDVGGVKLPLEAKAEAKADGKAAGARKPKASAYPAPPDSAARKALQLVATRWLAGRPFSLVGDDGDAALRTLADATGARVHDVVVDGDARLDALLGPGGAISAAAAAGGVVHLRLRGAAWPPGLGEALGAAGVDARVVATGPALPGVPALALPPLDEEALTSHGVAHGLAEQYAGIVAGVAVAFRQRTGHGLPLSVVERVAARMKLLQRGNDVYTSLQRAIRDVAGGGHDDADLRWALQQHIGVGEPGTDIEITRRTARIGDVPLRVVGAKASEGDLPAMTESEREELRAAALALEVKEPVAGDASTVERLGIGYGALTGRDVHIHMLHAASKPADVLSGRVGDVVIVAHGFANAPAAVREALWEAARDGRVRLLVEAGRDDALEGALHVEANAHGAGLADLTARAREIARALGMPEVVADGAAAALAGVQRDVAAGALHPLLPGDPGRELDNLLELLSDLMKTLPVADAFVSAVSATLPMSTLAEQQALEDAARAVVRP